MKFELYGKQLEFADAQLGIYKFNEGRMSYDYAEMDKGLLISVLNGLPKDTSKQQLRGLKEIAEKQLHSGTPNSIGAPILRGPEPIIEMKDVRSYIENTVSFCDYLLKELE